MPITRAFNSNSPAPEAARERAEVNESAECAEVKLPSLFASRGSFVPCAPKKQLSF